MRLRQSALPPRLLLPFVLLFMLFACNGTLISIDVNGEAETVVARGTVLEELVGSLGFGDFLNMDITSASELENQGVEPGDIQDVSLVLFSIEATDPDGADLSFLESVELFVEAPDLPRLLVASATSFPDGESLIDFVIEDVDLTDYVVSQSMTLSTDVAGRRPDADTTIHARYRLSVGVTGQGACAFTGG